MKDENKTKRQLLAELLELRKQITKMEALKAKLKRASKKVKVSREFIDRILNGIHEGVMVVGNDFKIQEVNNCFIKQHGRNREEIIGRHCYEITHRCLDASHDPQHPCPLEEVLATGESFHTEHIHKDLKGKDAVVEICAFPLIGASGDVESVVELIRDLTEPMRIKEVLRESEQRYRQLFEGISDAVMVYSLRGRFLDCNEVTLRRLGYSRKEFLRLNAANIVHPGFHQLMKENKKKILSGKTTVVELAHCCKDGRVIPVEVNARRIDYQGKSAILAVVRDMTERKKAEEALRKSEAFNFALFQHNPIQTIVVDKKGKIVRFNLAKSKSGDRLPDPGDIMFKDYAGKHKSNMYAELMKCIKSSEIREFNEKKYGGKFLSISMSPFPEGAIITSHDITERKRAEEALRKSESKYRDLVENINDVIYATDKKGTITYISPKIRDISGYYSSEVIGQDFIEFIYPEDKHYFMKMLKKVKSGEVKPNEFRILTKSNKVMWVSTFSQPIYKRKKFLGLRGVLTDINERKKAEEEKEKLQAQLIQSEKMAGIGTLASGIAHEFNNLLQIMRGHTEFAQRTKKAEHMEDALDIVLDTSDRVTKIIEDLLIFSRQESAEKEQCDITEPIESVLSLTEEQLKKHNIDIVRRYGRTPPIEVNKGEMQQVFLNMITNARDAMLPKGGKLEVSVKQVDKKVKVSFTDTGKGIEKENLGKVFEPFYTTKGATGRESKLQGTGLGLSVSFGIVNRQGGTIEVESEAKKGTTFTVRLPVKVARTEKGIFSQNKKKKIKKTRPLNILVIDDEEKICKMFTKFLSSNGHYVKTVTTGGMAINIVKKENFDVVFLDVIMPGTPGVKILEKIKEILPKTRVVMITGKLMNQSLVDELERKGASGFLRKPFNIEEVMEAIE